MKSFLFRLTAASVLLSGLSVSAHADESPLGVQMEAMNDAYKVFRRETDPAKGAEQARVAHEAIQKAMAELPETIQKMPDGPEKVKAVAQFRKMMGTLYVTLCDVEIAFLDGNLDEVAKLVESLKALKKEGHDAYIEE